jgi:hypothetical protein
MPTDSSHFALVAMQLVRGKVTPFLGAGVNLADRPEGAAWERGHNLPSGSELARYLAESYQYPDKDADLLRISQYVDARLGEGVLYEELRGLFAARYAPTVLHRFLAEMVPVLHAAGVRQQVLVTTNYDDLLEQALTEAGEEFDLLWYEAKRHDPNCGRFHHRAPGGAVELIDRPNEWAGIDLMARPAVLKLHGAIGASASDDSFVITEDNYIDYLSLTDVSTHIPMVLQDPLRNSHFLFMGYSLRDWNLRVILNRIWGQQKLALKSWSVQRNASELDEALWASRGTVEIIDEDVSAYVAALEEAVDACVSALPAA